MAAKLPTAFTYAAEAVARLRLQVIEEMSFSAALALPDVSIEDIVLAGKEVQLAVFRQHGVPKHPDAALVTVQITRAGMGGVINYQYESGLVFLPSGEKRQATEAELQATGS